MMNRFSLRGQAGQAHTEYGLILVLVGITVIGALTLMGQQVGGMWHTISASMPH
jgi:Flp pilus assembly pilin Flp